MDKVTIAKLAWYIPRTADIKDTCGGGQCNDGLEPALSDRAACIKHYARCYSNLSFGWDFAKAIRDGGQAFPSFLRGKDVYVWRAYNFLKGNPDRVVEGALELTLPSMRNTKSQIDALLVSKDVDTAYVAHNLALDKDVVDAYERLFFNVLDRKKDHAFIANVVYPHGRLVEAFENYLETVGVDELMMRAGFIYGKGHVLYAAGLAGNPYADYGASDGAQKLDAMFMTDGLLYATMGWMHQAHNSRPIENARLSMQAGKMGGVQETSGTGLLDLGTALRANLVLSAGQKAATSASILAGETYDV